MAPDCYNSGLVVPSPAYMEITMGWPRPTGQMGIDCRPVTDPHLKSKMVTQDLGPFKTTGHRLFLAVLADAFAELKGDHPDLHDLLGTAGCLCCRFIRGTHVPSNHSWGCAIDLTVGGELVPLGATYTLEGLHTLYGYLHKRKVYSGMGYRHRKDSMHFEASEGLVEDWKAAGQL